MAPKASQSTVATLACLRNSLLPTRDGAQLQQHSSAPYHRPPLAACRQHTLAGSSPVCCDAGCRAQDSLPRPAACEHGPSGCAASRTPPTHVRNALRAGTELPWHCCAARSQLRRSCRCCEASGSDYDCLPDGAGQGPGNMIQRRVQAAPAWARRDRAGLHRTERGQPQRPPARDFAQAGGCGQTHSRCQDNTAQGMPASCIKPITNPARISRAHLGHALPRPLPA